MTGTPCVDYSTANQFRMSLEGKTMPVLAWWAQTVLRLETPVWIHENVPQQPVEVFNVMLGSWYDIISLEVSPDMVGFGVIERKRRYILGLRKGSVEILADPQAVLKHVTQTLKGIRTRPRDALLASDEEVLTEVIELCSARRVQVPAAAMTCTALRQLDLRSLLTDRERRSLEDYEQAYFERFGHLSENDPDAFFNLGDNAGNRLTWSCVSGKLPTLRCSSGKVWSAYAKRWLTSLELLATMGFPTYEHLARSMGVAPMRFQNMAQARLFLGNAMHAAVAGVVVLVTFSCIRHVDKAE